MRPPRQRCSLARLGQARPRLTLVESIHHPPPQQDDRPTGAPPSRQHHEPAGLGRSSNYRTRSVGASGDVGPCHPEVRVRPRGHRRTAVDEMRLPDRSCLFHGGRIAALRLGRLVSLFGSFPPGLVGGAPGVESNSADKRDCNDDSWRNDSCGLTKIRRKSSTDR